MASNISTFSNDMLDRIFSDLSEDKQAIGACRFTCRLFKELSSPITEAFEGTFVHVVSQEGSRGTTNPTTRITMQTVASFGVEGPLMLQTLAGVRASVHPWPLPQVVLPCRNSCRAGKPLQAHWLPVIPLSQRSESLAAP